MNIVYDSAYENISNICLKADYEVNQDKEMGK